MVSEHGRLYMNLTGHTLKEFGTLKNLPIRLSLVQVGDSLEETDKCSSAKNQGTYIYEGT
jgi:hypothetical protein